MHLCNVSAVLQENTPCEYTLKDSHTVHVPNVWTWLQTWAASSAYSSSTIHHDPKFVIFYVKTKEIKCAV